jgi:hypothetical protein
MTKSEEEKLHSMLHEKFWGADVDEGSGLACIWSVYPCL